jgi:hypothetical protein
VAGVGIFLFAATFRPVLGPTQPYTQCLSGPRSLEVKQFEHDGVTHPI